MTHPFLYLLLLPFRFLIRHIHSYQNAGGTRQKIGVICSPSTHEAKIIVVIGLKYTQLVAFTVPSFEMHQFHVRKQIIEARQPRKSRLPNTCGRVNTSSGGKPGMKI